MKAQTQSAQVHPIRELGSEVDSQYGLDGRGDRLLSTVLQMLFNHRGVGLPAFLEDVRAGITHRRISLTGPHHELAEHLFGRDSIREVATVLHLPFSKVAPATGFLIPRILEILQRDGELPELSWSPTYQERRPITAALPGLLTTPDKNTSLPDSRELTKPPLISWIVAAALPVLVILALLTQWKSSEPEAAPQPTEPIRVQQIPVPDIARIVEDLNKSSPVFEPGSAKLTPQSASILAAIGAQMGNIPDGQAIAINGHTDSSGRADRNVKLSQERAEAVKTILLQSGARPDQLLTRGFGATSPIAPNDTAENKKRNRRIEFIAATTAVTRASTSL